MAKDESKKISEDIHKIEGDVRSYKKELPAQWSEKGVYNVHKLLTRAKEEESHLIFKLHKAERKEKGDDMEKRKRNQDSSTHSD